MPASLTTAFGNDYKVGDNFRTISFVSKDLTLNTTMSVGFATQFDTTDDLASPSGQGAFNSVDTVWQFPVSQLASTPKEGDSITYGGTTWIVLRVEKIAWDTLWKCDCKQERV